MTKCANCTSDAVYEYRVTLKNSIFYCGNHLPKFLEARKKAMLIGTTEAFAKANEEALSVLEIQPTETAPEPVVDEAPAPKKRTSKKAK